jgi:HAD superfamily hydrolase (TIGR01484 family)
MDGASTLLPLARFPVEKRHDVRVVMTDIDDTLTDEGKLTAAAYDALEQLKSAGFIVIPVTGRPAGWCDMIARFWPVDAVVGENGAFYFRYDITARRMFRRYAKTDSERARDRKRLVELADAIPREVKGSAIASDQAYREADLAIDFCEDVAALEAADIDRIAEMFRQHGATAKISSIHVNGWFGQYDKLSMSRLVLEEIFQIDMEAEKERIVFVGDSPNDAPMFGFFPNSVGVANVLRYRGRIPAEPRWVTQDEGGQGFIELADSLLAAR